MLALGFFPIASSRPFLQGSSDHMEAFTQIVGKRMQRFFSYAQMAYSRSSDLAQSEGNRFHAELYDAMASLVCDLLIVLSQLRSQFPGMPAPILVSGISALSMKDVLRKSGGVGVDRPGASAKPKRHLHLVVVPKP